MLKLYFGTVDTRLSINLYLTISIIPTSTIAPDLVTTTSIVTINMSADDMSVSNMSVFK